MSSPGTELPRADCCPQCGASSNSKENRLITDSCGHQRCRRCVLVDEACLECTRAHTQVSTEPKEEMSVVLAAEDDVIKTNKKRSGGTMPAHLQRLQLASGAMGYHCTACGKRFTSRSQQYYHLDCGQVGDRRYKCGQCEKSFSTHSHLKYHEESHGSRIYHCTQCTKTFKNRIVLKKHERLHQQQPVGKCIECSKVFRCKQALRAHIAQHDKDYQVPFKCAICEKGYALKSTLQQHMLKHKEKKYQCPHCDKRFQRNSTLKLHLKRHSKTDSFICMICLSKFSDASVLLRHAKLHEDSVKYQCTECDTLTARKDNMTRHVRNMHPGRSFQECVELLKPETTDKTATASKAMSSPIEPDAVQRIAESSSYLPKTIENSSVIKCIGNVEPVKIPNIDASTTETTSINMETGNKHDSSTNLATLETVNHNPNCPISTASVQKKVKKKYDPIEMYRKILTSDCEDLSEDDDAAKQRENSNTEQTTQPTEKRIAANTSNFSEMHWRKNFKYTYEYQEY